MKIFQKDGSISRSYKSGLVDHTNILNATSLEDARACACEDLRKCTMQAYIVDPLGIFVPNYSVDDGDADNAASNLLSN